MFVMPHTTLSLLLDKRRKTTVQNKSMLIVMRGYPGTGKSTVARQLAALLYAPLLDRDILRRAAVDHFGDSPDAGPFAYKLLFELVREQLGLGLSVVVDTPLTYRRTYDRCLEIAQGFQATMLVVHCQCPPPVQKCRLEGRKGQVSDFQITSWEEWERWKPRFEEFEDHGCVIDTSRPLGESIAMVMRHILDLHQLNAERAFSECF
jgi:predicted kinase